MKVKILNDDTFYIYLNKFYLKEIDLTNKIDLELYFKSLFLKLKNSYNMKMEGFYIIDVYKDKFYGIILKIRKEEFSYFDVDSVDMRIRIKERNFYYKLLNIDKIKLFNSFGKLYKNKENIYLKINKNLNNYNLGLIEEYSQIIFENTIDIEKHLKLINQNML